MSIRFGRSLAGDAGLMENREWLVTNGLGGFALGTVSGVATRRYHGLLFAATTPPVGRRLLVFSLDATLSYDGRDYELFTNRWGDDTTGPDSSQHLAAFEIDGGVPTWTYACGDAKLTRRVWMEQGANATYVTYALTGASTGAKLAARAMVNDRDFNSTTSAGEWRMQLDPIGGGVRVRSAPDASPFFVRADRGTALPMHEWYHNYLYVEERARGLGDREDHLHAVSFEVSLEPGQSVTFEMALGEPVTDSIKAAGRRRTAHDRGCVERWRTAFPDIAAGAPEWIERLVLAADQFAVVRPLESDPGARSIIAGYPWFGDWGRDTMIALPGLTIATGNADVAVRTLETFAKFVDGGMIPNFFPDASNQPEYNTVDASLWFIEAVRQAFAATESQVFLLGVWPALCEIFEQYKSGTRFGIHEDPADGLIAAGGPGLQLTWMDAKVGDWVVTPRIGKPVEVNALWLNALYTMADLAKPAGDVAAAKRYKASAAQTEIGFKKYWNAERGCLFDVLDGPDGNDPALRPNQLLAVSLNHTALTNEQQRAVVDVCARRLYTTMGLRSLAPDDPHYRGTYGGSQLERDGAYHQGTVWGWLIGPFSIAVFRAYGDRDRALSYLRDVGSEIDARGLGTLPEIAEGNAPHGARGCIAQAWTVGEVLRAWTMLAKATPS